jgi:uncharacterized protein
MLEVVSSALVMGLSASTYCLASCVPVLIPYAGIAGKPSIFSGLSLALLFSFGRLIAYTGLLVAFIVLKQLVGVNSIVVAVAMMTSGALLLLSALATFGLFRQFSSFNRIMCGYVAGSKSPFYLGILTGVKPCGPLLAAIAFVLALPNAAKGGIFMLVFWLTSSVVLLLLGSIGGGVMSALQKHLGIDRLRRIAAIAMVVIGMVLILQGIGVLSSL